MSDEEPDYRFSLANERTYLAWIRTGLALIAGGIAIRIFIDDLGGGWLVHVAAVGPALLGGVLAVTSYRHWISVQDAMRRGAALPSQQGPLILTIGMVGLSAVVSIGLLL
jgi:putative membrane protein